MPFEPYDLPDFFRGTVLLGQDPEGTVVPVLIDADGQINILVRGVDDDETVRTIKVDDAGQLYAILRGADDVDVAVDAAGNLAAIMKGLAPGDVLTAIALDAAGRIIMVPYGTTSVSGTATVTQVAKDREVQGADGETLRTLAVDGSGQMIMVPRGQSGYYMAVDASGFLSALVKGIDGGSILRTLAVDTSGQIIMVPRGSSGYYLSVDANGYMTAVLKGAHDSTLTTIAVDAGGRIDAYLNDGSDQWGQQLRVGNADLAGRLGSPVTWDWRGTVLYQHDFSMGKGPIFTSLSGTGAAAAVDPTYGGYGGYALKLTGGSDATRFSRFGLSVGTNPSDRVGGAVRFSIADNTGYVELRLQAYVGDPSPWGFVRLDVANGQIQVYEGAPAWRNVGAVTVNKEAFTYCWFKLVIDQSTGKYERVMYNNSYVDISAYDCPEAAASDDNSLLFCLYNYSRSGENDVVYVDQVLLTVNEPVNPA